MGLTKAATKLKIQTLVKSRRNDAADEPIRCHGIRQTLEGSFSAVSKPNFASKYAFESSRRDLHNALLCTAPKSHFFQKISRICQNLRKFSEILRNSQFFKPIFCEKFEIAAVQKDVTLVELEKRSGAFSPRVSNPRRPRSRARSNRLKKSVGRKVFRLRP